MDTREPGLDARIRDLEAAVDRLSERVRALELSVRVDLAPLNPKDAPSRADALSALTSPSRDRPVQSGLAPDRSGPGWISLAGRTFIVLAGAFLLRALTEGGQLPTTGGVWAGLGYAVLWMGLAGRTVGRSSLVHGLSALMIGLPIIIEAGTRFRVLSPTASALVLTALALAGLGVAARRRLAALAAMTVLGALGTALAIAVALDAFLPPTLAVFLVTAAVFWIAEARGWPTLTWPASAAANLLAAMLAVRAAATPPRDMPVAAGLALGALVSLHLGATMIRVLLHDRAIRSFDVAATAASLLVGLGGAVAVAHAQGASLVSIGIPCVIGAAVMYVQAFTTAAARHGAGREFYYFGMTAEALALVGVAVLIPAPAGSMLIGAAAILCSLIAWRAHHPMLALQGAVAALTAAALSGLAVFAARSWLTYAGALPAAGMPIWFVLAAVAIAVLMPRAAPAGGVPGDASGLVSSAARTALLVVLAAGIASLLVTAVAPALMGSPSRAGALATVKSVILAGAAVVLAFAARLPRFSEAAWVAWAALLLGALKIVVEDFPRSRPATLFVALAAYGAVLIFVPKIVRRAESPVPTPQKT